MKESVTNYEAEALKLKSLLTVIAGVDADNIEMYYSVADVAKMARDTAENLYCAIADNVLVIQGR